MPGSTTAWWTTKSALGTDVEYMTELEYQEFTTLRDIIFNITDGATFSVKFNADPMLAQLLPRFRKLAVMNQRRKE